MKKIFLWLLIVSIIVVFSLAGCKSEVAEEVTETDEEEVVAEEPVVEEVTDEPAVEPLIEALKDEDWHVRSSAVEALIKIGGPAVEPLIKALKDEDSNSDFTQQRLLRRLENQL